ncbi:MAG: response regulator [Armatimonadota bacterium]
MMAKVLIVEADAQISEVAVKLLNGRGYHTRVEANGASALLAAHEDPPDVILMDLTMPILTGQEAIQALRQAPRTAHIPVVVFSRGDNDNAVAEALVAGANAFLTTPLIPQELLSIVARLVTLQGSDPVQRA